MGRSGNPERRRAFVEGVVAGKTLRRAALDAGYSENMADQPGKKIVRYVQGELKEAIRRRIRTDKIVSVIESGLDASDSKFFAHEGVVMDQRDVPAWSDRREYAKLAVMLGGMSDQGDMDGQTIKVQVEMMGGMAAERRMIAEQAESDDES